MSPTNAIEEKERADSFGSFGDGPIVVHAHVRDRFVNILVFAAPVHCHVIIESEFFMVNLSFQSLL